MVVAAEGTTMTLKTQLDYVQKWERERPNDIWFTQPLGKGEIRDLSFKEALDEARRMAAHLRSLDFPAQSKIALFSKNTAWWILADIAIWMAGHVSVPLYPTLTAETIRQILEHSEAKLIFIGKLDGFTVITRACESENLRALYDAGDLPGYLWKQGLFEGLN